MPICKKCGEGKSELDFRIYAVNGIDYVRKTCRECERKYMRARYAADPKRAAAASRKWAREHKGHHNATKRAWYANNTERHRSNVLRRAYGITLADYERMLSEQGGCCGICRTETTGNCGRRLSVDHDHETGKVRGLLCGRCNSMLGFIKEHPGALERAIDWVKK